LTVVHPVVGRTNVAGATDVISRSAGLAGAAEATDEAAPKARTATDKRKEFLIYKGRCK